MTVGSKIQFHRKRLELSQEQLGQKLLVSRQTISLWEKDQTLPSIDNLIKLKEIFGVSIDEILCGDCLEKQEIVLPKETYQLRFSQQEFSDITSYFRKPILHRFIITLLIETALFIYLFAMKTPNDPLACLICIVLFTIFLHIKKIINHNKSYSKYRNKILNSNYNYQIFDSYFQCNVERNDEIVKTLKIYWNDIEQVNDTGKHLAILNQGQILYLRKKDLIDNSKFYSFMKRNPTKTVKPRKFDIFKFLTVILIILSFSLLPIGVSLAAILSKDDPNINKCMWVYFTLIPIPLSLIVLGVIMKKKGYKYKKNIVIGIIVTALLSIYGSFYFLFPDDVFLSSQYPTTQQIQYVEQSNNHITR